MRFGLILSLLFVSGAGEAHAGAWTQDQGNTLVITTATTYTASQMYNNSGHLTPQATYTKYTLNPYIEYGLTDDWTLGANLALMDAHQDGGNGSSSASEFGLGDSEFFVRRKVWQQDGFVLSAQPLIKLPSPESSANDTPQLGGAHPDIAMGLSGGYGFQMFGLNDFVNLDTQYRYRFGPPKDQLHVDTTAGIGISEKWMIMPQVFTTWRTAVPGVASYTESSGDDYDLVQVQLSGVYAWSPSLSFQIGGFDDVYGKNTGQGKGVLFSVWKHL